MSSRVAVLLNGWMEGYTDKGCLSQEDHLARPPQLQSCLVGKKKDVTSHSIKNEWNFLGHWDALSLLV